MSSPKINSVVCALCGLGSLWAIRLDYLHFRAQPDRHAGLSPWKGLSANAPEQRDSSYIEVTHQEFKPLARDIPYIYSTFTVKYTLTATYAIVGPKFLLPTK
jgi:hypothetical protein